VLFISVCGLTTKNNKEQEELVRLIMDNSKQIIYCTGAAGTGKTIVSVATALQMIRDGKYGGKCGKKGKIFYIREPIETGRSLGYLPGEVDEKYSVYLDGLRDNLENLENIGEQINAREELKKIECIPPQYMRGRSIDQAILIIDEAQNLSMLTIRTILTRLGKYTKAILLGSTNQIDVKNMTKDNNDFMRSYEKLKEFDFVGYVHLVKSERSDICAIIDDALAE